jgi:two-component system, cell cycle response regulator DivK
MTPAPRDVLVVDDNSLNLELATHVLESDGYTVRQAASGSEALRVVREATPDLILMDIGMPQMDGYAVLAELRRDPATARIPVVALTAYAMAEDERRIRAAGFDGYITKPFAVRALAAALARILEQTESTT